MTKIILQCQHKTAIIVAIFFEQRKVSKSVRI